MVTKSIIENIITEIFDEYSQPLSTEEEVRYQKVIDTENSIYILKTLGWSKKCQINAIIFDFEIIENKLYIHFDGTEDGIALKFEARGIPKEQIVLAWIRPSQRKYTDYAET